MKDILIIHLSGCVISSSDSGLFRNSITSFYNAIRAEKQQSNSKPVVDSCYFILVDLFL